MLQKAHQTQPLKNQQLCFELNEAFLIKRGFLHALVVLWFGPSTFQNLAIHVSTVRCQYEKSSCCASVPTSPRNLESFSVHQVVDPGIVEITLHVVPESKPNPVSPQFYFENDAFFLAFLIKMFFVNSGPSLPKARHKPERRGGGKTGMIDVNGKNNKVEQKNNKVEQKNNKKTKTMGDVTLKGYDMTNTVTKGTGVRVHKQ